MPDEAGRSQRSFENRGGKWRRWALTVIASAGAGAVVIAPPMAALIDDSTPPTLATAPEPTTGPVTKELTHDERLVEVRVSQPESQTLHIPRSGTLTASACEPGASVVSGTATFSVDGLRLLNLHTAVPLWRGLEQGDSGADVSALQRELVRLGANLMIDGLFGQQTASALDRIRQVSGALPSPTDGPETSTARSDLDQSEIIWLPAPHLTIASCARQLGTVVAANDDLLVSESAVVGAKVTSGLQDALPGPRVLILPDGSTVDLQEGGVVTIDDNLPALLEADEASDRAAHSDPAGGDAAGGSNQPGITAGQRTISLRSRLLTERSVWSVPAGAVRFKGENAYVCSESGRVEVEVVSSRLGASIVVSRKGELGDRAYLSHRSTGC